MSEKYQIEIDDRAVLVVVRQYDASGNEVVIENILPPGRIRPAKQSIYMDSAFEVDENVGLLAEIEIGDDVLPIPPSH